MTVPEKIFLNTFFDLEDRLEKCMQYDLIRASGLIRQLLIDGNSLVEQVNKGYQLKIRFRVQERFDLPMERIGADGTVMKAWIGITFISPDEKSKSVEFLSKDDFLKYKLLHFSEHNFNVIDVIKICAHKYGGVHSDTITDAKDMLLDEASKSFTLNDSPMVYQAMHGIATVCKNALEPLKNKILEKYKPAEDE